MSHFPFFLIGFPIGALFVSAIYRARAGALLEAAWMLVQLICLLAAVVILISRGVA